MFTSQTDAPPRAALSPPEITAATLGSAAFRAAHGIRYAYVAGAMYKGIASADLVIQMGRAGLLGFFGTGGLRLEKVEQAILQIKGALPEGTPFGMNLLCNLIKPDLEESTVDLFFQHDIRRVEAAAYTQITPSLVRFRLKGLCRDSRGKIIVPHRIVAKVSRPEVAERFLAPAPEKILQKLLQTQKISEQEAILARSIPMADDLCIEADSAGHTDNGVAYALMPAMLRLRDEAMKTFAYPEQINVGAAGGLGTPHALAAAFILGADFVLTGSVNQCTVEAGTSDLVKDLLAGMNVQDTEMAPAGDMFEMGARVQVLSKGLFFAARANKLYDLYKQHECLEAIDPKTREQLETRILKRSFEDIYRETKEFYLKIAPEQIERAERNPKFKMALVFRWYFVQSSRLAQQGLPEGKVDFQIHCGPALGAFNQWVKGTPLEDWRTRHVDEIAELLMKGAASLLNQRFRGWHGLASETDNLNRLVV